MVVWSYDLWHQGQSISLSPSLMYLFCGASSSYAPLHYLTELEAPVVPTKPQNRQYETNVQNSQQIILGSKTVWKENQICTRKKT